MNSYLIGIKKTQAIVFGSARYINVINLQGLPSIRVDDVTVQFSSYIKYLGITISSTLSWDRQMTNTANKIQQSLYQLKLCKRQLPQPLRIKFISALIFPHLDYCCCAITDVTKELNLTKGLKCMHQIYIYNLKSDEHITPHYRTLRWLKTSGRRTYFVGCLTYSLLMVHKRHILSEAFHFREQARLTRATADTLAVPLYRTEIFKRTFICSAIRVWNGIPSNMHNLQSAGQFKAVFFKHLLDSSNP